MVDDVRLIPLDKDGQSRFYLLSICFGFSIVSLLYIQSLLLSSKQPYEGVVVVFLNFKCIIKA